MTCTISSYTIYIKLYMLRYNHDNFYIDLDWDENVYAPLKEYDLISIHMYMYVWQFFWNGGNNSEEIP